MRLVWTLSACLVVAGVRAEAEDEYRATACRNETTDSAGTPGTASGKQCYPLVSHVRSLPEAVARQLDDFEIQGEYTGWVWNGGNCVWSGLQVVALGEGMFDAMFYRGGLPGQGGDPATRGKLHGATAGEATNLAGDGLKVVIDANRQVQVTDDAGRVLGTLQPTVRSSPTLGAAPLAGARVLFDGRDASGFQNPRVTDDGLLMVGTETVQPYRDFTLHLEFRTPYMPEARGQGRGNSGLYIQGRYEVQILDSFGLEGADNECAGLYKTRAPDANLCFPPLTWQTYDIGFRAARFDEAGHKTASARINVWHNGVLVQNNVEIPDKTGAGAAEGPDPRPIKLQDHGNPVHFRNLWIVEHAETVAASPACTPTCTTCRKHGRHCRGKRVCR